MKLQPFRFQRIALRYISTLKTAREPVHALAACAMGKAFGHYRTLRLALQRVVADLRGGVQRFFDIALFQPSLDLCE